jgi:hypothetical protein
MKSSVLLEEVYKLLHLVNRQNVNDLGIQCACECVCVCVCVVTVYDSIPHMLFHIHFLHLPSVLCSLYMYCQHH